MKTRIAFFTLLAVSAAMVASAQVEHDDMYFNSKDRAKLQAAKPLILKSMASEQEIATVINPTDSYSARNVNPEYISQSRVNPSGSAQSAPYFIPDYSPIAINQNLYTNYNNNSAWSNPNFGMMPGFGMMPRFGMMSGFGNPYGNYYPSMYGNDPYGYNGFNNFGFNSFNNFGYNNFYNQGWGSSFSLSYGMGSMNNWGGFGCSPFGNSYYGMNSFGGWNNFGGGNYYSPTTVVIINNRDNNGRDMVYGKRVSRSNDLDNNVTTAGRSTVAPTVVDSQGRTRGANGRVASNDATNTNTYYQRGWRANPETNSSSTTRTTWSNSGRSSTDSNNSRSNSSFFDNSSNSRSNSNSNFGGSNFNSGGGSRSSSGGGASVGGGGSSSSGARRGRD